MKVSLLTTTALFMAAFASAQDINGNTEIKTPTVGIDETATNEQDFVETRLNEEDVEFDLEEEDNVVESVAADEKITEETEEQDVYNNLLDLSNVEKEEGLPVETEQLNNTPKSVNYTIDFSIFESPEGDGLQIPYIVEYNETTYINYTFVNNEEHNTTVIGLTGYVLDIDSQETVANLTHGRLNPTLVQPGQKITFDQPFSLSIEDGYYYISPIVHVMIDSSDNPIGVTATPRVIDLQPAPVGFFNASFLSIIATCVVMALTTYHNYQKTTKKSGFNKPELKKLAKTVKIDKDEWVPKEYKK
ncbi:hypothetical protein QEN19_004116 [Hanseniaspora menglaensis]